MRISLRAALPADCGLDRTKNGVGGAVPLPGVILSLFGLTKQVGSYFGLIPSEESSGGKQRLGRISKQGSSFLRFLLVEAGQTVARLDPQLKRFYRRLAMRKNRSIANVAVARKLATRLLPDVGRGLDVRATQSGRHAGQPGSFCGRRVRPERLSGQPASLNSQGDRSE
jgi:hypothetical protein